MYAIRSYYVSMQRQAQHIEKSQTPLKKIDIKGDDEIFDLSLKINSMIDALQANEKSYNFV